MLRDRYARRRFITFMVLVLMSLALIAVSRTGPAQELRNGVRFAVGPVQDTLGDGTRSVTSVLGAITEVDTLRRENDELTEAVDRLQDQLATLDALKAENKKLNKLLKTKNDLADHRTVAATVSQRHASQFERTITLDRGSEANIGRGDPVLSSGGALAGQVTAVGDGWAEVMLITDTNFLVNGLDNRTGATGNVVGRLAAPLAMVEIPRGEKISDKDLVVTMGAKAGKRFRSRFPKGIPIGHVIDVIEEPGEVLKTALITPRADLEHLEHVLVIVQGKAAQQKAKSDDAEDGEDAGTDQGAGVSEAGG